MLACIRYWEVEGEGEPGVSQSEGEGGGGGGEGEEANTDRRTGIHCPTEYLERGKVRRMANLFGLEN